MTTTLRRLAYTAAFLGVLGLDGGVGGASPTAPFAGVPDVPRNMKSYYVCLLSRGPRWSPPDSPEAKALLPKHMAFMRHMLETRRFALAGPFLDGGALRGLGVVAAASLDEARALVSRDPEVQAGHLAVELHPAMLPALDAVHVDY